MRRVVVPAMLLVISVAAPVAAVASDSAVAVSLGLGLAAPRDSDVDGSGSGGYADVEYVHWADRWFSPRAYAGVLLSSDDGECGRNVTPCDVSARIAFAGGKFRLMAPIPYVGPFIELGLGVSAGRISTRSGSAVDARGRGLMYHVPWSIGLALGRRHEYELAFKYLEHPEQEQFSGAVALGFAFAL